MTLPEQIEQLKEDYKRRIATFEYALESEHLPAPAILRIQERRGEYHAFLADLNRLKEPQP